MTKQIEIVDALPGSGKTYSIFDYMADDQSKPWLYLSPLESEVLVRVKEEADRVGMAFFSPQKAQGTLAPQALELFKEGKNVACTHALTLFFKKEHIEYIKSQGYRIVCDEELNLIDAYKIHIKDIEFLYSENMISKDVNNLGRMSFLKTDMSEDARYGDIKRLCDRGCLYGEKTSDTMLVTYLSPDLILSANRFILLTYNFGGSIMQAFLSLHGITNKELQIPLKLSTEKNKEELRTLFEFVEPPSVKKLLEAQGKFNLSSSWWEADTIRKGVNPSDIKKLLGSLPKSQGVPSGSMYFTLPMSNKEKIKSRNISMENLIACNCRATNDYEDKLYCIHAFNIYMNVTVKSYLSGYGYEVNEDDYALNQAIQWVFRGCVRKRKVMKVTFLSKRMSVLFKEWLLK